MVNSEGLIGTTEHVMLYVRCCLKQCCYNWVQLYCEVNGYTWLQLQVYCKVSGFFASCEFWIPEYKAEPAYNLEWS
jgi:hypothetical protein